jgi:murein DD-endopeptidase MepM/ murein hydrolase activator NlpD
VTYYPKIAAWSRITPDYIHTEAGDKLFAEAEEAEKAAQTPAPVASSDPAPSAPQTPASAAPKASAPAPKAPAASVQVPKPVNSGIKDMPVKGRNKPCGLTDRIPEEQLRSPNYPHFEKSPVGDITITGGFMEDHGHSRKPPQKAIFEDGELRQLPASDRNLGIDYKEEKWKILTWFGGTVERVGLEGGYGNRIVIKTNVTYRFQGKDYVVYQAYGHAASFMDNIRKGQKIGQSQHIGTMGGTGKRGKRSYAPHIDCRTYIIINGEIVDLSLNALEAQLRG